MRNLETNQDENLIVNTDDKFIDHLNDFMQMKILQKINSIVDFRDRLKDKNSNEIDSSDTLNFYIFKKALIDSVNKIKEIPGIYDCYREFSLILDTIREKKIFSVEYSEIEKMTEICEIVMIEIDNKLKKKTNKIRNLKNRIRKLKKSLNS
jgi:hypothetical protein